MILSSKGSQTKQNSTHCTRRNDFIKLVIRAYGKEQNKIERVFIKNVLRLSSKFAKSANIKKKVSTNLYMVIKNLKFFISFKSCEKVCKICRKKVTKTKIKKIWSFF